MARASTTGTKIEEIRSARRCTGAFVACAACRARTIAPNRVCPPTVDTNTTSRPCPLTEAPTTSLPGATSTGTDSPVSRERSTDDMPSTTTPSAGTVAPGYTTTCIPGRSSSSAIGSLAVVGRAHGLRRHARQERPRRIAGGRARAGLECLADEDQRHDHGGGVEVRHRHDPGWRRQHLPHRVPIGGGGAERDQRVHRCRPMACGAERRARRRARRPRTRPGSPAPTRRGPPTTDPRAPAPGRGLPRCTARRPRAAAATTAPPPPGHDARRAARAPYPAPTTAPTSGSVPSEPPLHRRGPSGQVDGDRVDARHVVERALHLRHA